MSGITSRSPSIALGLLYIGMLLGTAAAAADVSHMPQELFTLKRSFDVSNEDVTDARDFIVIGKHAYILSTNGMNIHRYDMDSKEFRGSVGGAGNGPGEFTMPVYSLASVNGLLYVTTVDSWVHVFSDNLEFRTRKFMVSLLSDFAALANGHAATCTMALPQKIGDPVYGISRFDAEMETTGTDGSFAFHNALDNMMLSRCLLAGNTIVVAYAQVGEAAVYYYNQKGDQIRRVAIDQWKGEIRFMPESADNPAKQMLASFGVKDQRTPLGGLVQTLHMNPHYTLVQGGITTHDRLRSLVFVDHATWHTHYARLPKACRSMRLQGDSMYCLITDGDQVLLEEYSVKSPF